MLLVVRRPWIRFLRKRLSRKLSWPSTFFIFMLSKFLRILNNIFWCWASYIYIYIYHRHHVEFEIVTTGAKKRIGSCEVPPHLRALHKARVRVRFKLEVPRRPHHHRLSHLSKKRNRRLKIWTCLNWFFPYTRFIFYVSLDHTRIIFL